ncbi:MAG: MXAN_6640 family putative metalloprotease [bacterium]
MYRSGMKKSIFPKFILKAQFMGFFSGSAGLCLWLILYQQVLWAQPQPIISQSQQSIISQAQLNREISALFQPSRQQGLEKSDLSSSAPMTRCATPLLRRAIRHQELLYPENTFILHRPTDFADDDYYGSGIEVWSYESSGGHFRIYYTEDNTGSGNAVRDTDGRKDTIPQDVLHYVQYFEQAWHYIIDTLGYHAPIEDGSKIEVYILNLGSYGATSADRHGLYIMVDNDFQGISDNLDKEGKVAGAMKVTSAHELFHVVQAGYDDWPNDYLDRNIWWEENTAVWVEDELYDEIDDYLHYLGWPYDDRNDNGKWDYDAQGSELYFDIHGKPVAGWRGNGWFDYPFISLNKTGSDAAYPLFEYGGVIWAKFLSEHFGQGIVKTIFERISDDPSRDALTAIRDLAQEADRGMVSFSDVFIRFKLANLFRSYEEGGKYPMPRHQSSYSTYPISLIRNSLDYLSCAYHAFQKPPSGQALRIQFDDQGNAPCAVLAVPATSYQSSPQFGIAQLIPLDDVQHKGSFDFSFEQNPVYSKLVIIPINLSWTGIAFYDLNAQVIAIDQAQIPPVPQEIHYSIQIRDGHPRVRLAWRGIQEIAQYQIWRGLEGRFQSMIFSSLQQQPQKSEEQKGDGTGEESYQDSNSYEDSDPALEFNRLYLYQVKRINAQGSSSSEIIEVETGQETPAQNHPPLFNHLDDKEIDEGTLLKFTVAAVDPDGDNLTYSASNLPPGADFNPQTGEFSWKPDPDQTGSYTITFTATDNGSDPLSGSVNVIVTVHEGLFGGEVSCFIRICSQRVRWPFDNMPSDALRRRAAAATLTIPGKAGQELFFILPMNSR